VEIKQQKRIVCFVLVRSTYLFVVVGICLALYFDEFDLPEITDGASSEIKNSDMLSHGDFFVVKHHLTIKNTPLLKIDVPQKVDCL